MAVGERKKHAIIRWLGWWLVAVTVSGCTSVDVWMRERVYKPQTLSMSAWLSGVAQLGYTADAVPTPKGNVQLLVAGATGADVPAVLYLHGTYRHALGNAPKLRPMVDAGWAVYAPDYRGWGASAPDLPDEAGIHADAWAVWQQLRPRHKRWLIVGHSMGTAVAAQLAARVGEAPELCGVVLESGFPSFARVAAFSSGVLGVGVTALGHQRMDTAAAARQLRVPVWVWHGERDRTIDVALGRELFDALSGDKRWETWPSDHSDLQDDPSGRYAQRWRELAARCGSRP